MVPLSFIKNALKCLSLLIEFGIFPFCLSPQKMEVLRQDVEEIEKEMEQLRAYLAKTDEKREEPETTIEDGMEYQDKGKIKEARPARRWCFHLRAFPCFEFPLRLFPAQSC